MKGGEKMKKIAKYSLVAVLLSVLVVPAVVGAQGFGLNYATALDLGTKDLRESAIDIINVVLGFLGIVAIIIILWGGFMWMTAGGNEEKVTKARQLLVAGITGLVIILAAYAIARFVITQVYDATGGGTAVAEPEV